MVEMKKQKVNKLREVTPESKEGDIKRPKKWMWELKIYNPMLSFIIWENSNGQMLSQKDQ